MSQENEKKELSHADYARLCRQACQGFAPSGSREADEETLMSRVFRQVYRYLEEDLDAFPVVDASNLQTYKSKVRQLVSQRQSEWFDTLETPGKYINEKLDKAYS